MRKEHKKVCTALNYIEQSLVLVSPITACVSISTFASLVGAPFRYCKFCSTIKNLGNDWKS